VHYQGTVPRETYLRGVGSILAQTFKDYELLVYHDGPLLDPEAPTPVPMRCSDVRYNDWGHSLRDRGIREATGDYIVHVNADNILYPDALELIDAEIRRPHRIFLEGVGPMDHNNIIIFPIVMHGYQQLHEYVLRLPGSEWKMILTGNPPILGNIDAMQFVMKRSLWLAEGGWHDKRADSDGHMYQVFAKKYGYRNVGAVLGEHY
jgi:glycosyltransferase involved in cell wall biosynthesis